MGGGKANEKLNKKWEGEKITDERKEQSHSKIPHQNVLMYAFSFEFNIQFDSPGSLINQIESKTEVCCR